MIFTLKNTDGYIYAYMEWSIVNKEAQHTRDGEYLYVRDLWVHKKSEGIPTIRLFIQMLNNHKIMKKVKWVYWQRYKKYKDKETRRISRTFSRSVCLHQIKDLL